MKGCKENNDGLCVWKQSLKMYCYNVVVLDCFSARTRVCSRSYYIYKQQDVGIRHLLVNLEKIEDCT